MKAMLGMKKTIKRNLSDPFVIKEGGFKYGKLEKYSHLREWIESSFLPRGRQGEVVGRTFDPFRLKMIGFASVLLLLVLGFRAGWLQIHQGDYYSGMAESNSVRFQRLEAKRGIIYDDKRRPLVRNVANFILSIVPADLPREEEKRNVFLDEVSAMVFPSDQGEREKLASTTKERVARIKRGSLESYRPLLVADDIPYDRAMLIYIKANDLPGVILSNKGRREYLADGVLSLSHIFGYTGKVNQDDLEKFGGDYASTDYIGKDGLESFWETELRGQSGQKRIEVDALGHEKKIISQTEAKDGYNLVLSLDYELQKKVEEILIANLKSVKQDRGVAIVMDPNNGEILAMVSLPAFDNSLFARGITGTEYAQLAADKSKPLFNRAVSGEYPSGSIVKPVFAAGALQEKVISEKTSFVSTGGLAIGQWFFPDWKAGGHGRTDVRKAIADSVNTFFYYISGGYKEFAGLGIERMVKYLRLFGVGMETGVDLPGESPGFVPSKEWKEKVRGEKWYIGDTYHLGIGQGDLLVTPLQAANWTAVFANGGKLFRPHLVKEILGKDDEVVQTIDEQPIREDFIDDYNLEVVRQGMRRTVTAGSAQRLKDLPVETAGKTGTAQWGVGQIPHAWFTCFAPYKNPEIVVTVLVEEGKEGSQVALSAAKDILAYYFSKDSAVRSER